MGKFKPAMGYQKPRRGKKKELPNQLHTELMNFSGDIDNDVCFKAYGLANNTKCDLHGLPNPKIKNCRQNPYCIHRVGNEKWDRLRRDLTENSAPELIRRDVDTEPCGLANFGNYCYVNSFLQIWFNDLPFRQTIFDWRPVEGWQPPPNAKMNIQDVMNCLQELFLTLQISPYGYTNALEFISLLKLDNEQHDVQEFTILFFDALDRYLREHPNGEPIRRAIKSRYEGVGRQTIGCACGHRSVTDTPFLSLTLTIDGYNTLGKALEGYFQDEELTDFKCSACGQAGRTTRGNCSVRLPPVLMLQLNRYTFDQMGRNKKLTAAIQYPRQLSGGDLRLEQRSDAPPLSYHLSAVMIHEGQSANCGHYYDVIKHPNSDRWFSYNDKVVTEAKPLGLPADKGSTSRATADMRGCYALIYRVDDQARLHQQHQPPPITHTSQLRMPAAAVKSIETKLNDTFARENHAGNRSWEIWQECINEKRDYLERLWVRLEVENEQVVRQKPASVVFLPTALLGELHKKEYQSVERMRNLDQLSSGQASVSLDETLRSRQDVLDEAIHLLQQECAQDELDDDQYAERLEEVMEEVARRKAADLRQQVLQMERTCSPEKSEEAVKLVYTMEPTADVTMVLCPHGKVPVDRVNKGEIKAVNRAPAEEMLEHYAFKVRWTASDNDPTDRDPITTLQSCLARAQSNRSSLDICADCVQLMRKDLNSKDRLDERAKLAAQIIKRAQREPYPPAGTTAFWVSRRQLASYKKFVNQELVYQRSLAQRTPPKIRFTTREPTSARKSSCESSEESRKQTVDEPSPKKRKVDLKQEVENLQIHNEETNMEVDEELNERQQSESSTLTPNSRPNSRNDSKPPRLSNSQKAKQKNADGKLNGHSSLNNVNPGTSYQNGDANDGEPHACVDQRKVSNGKVPGMNGDAGEAGMDEKSDVETKSDEMERRRESRERPTNSLDPVGEANPGDSPPADPTEPNCSTGDKWIGDKQETADHDDDRTVDKQAKGDAKLEDVDYKVDDVDNKLIVNHDNADGTEEDEFGDKQDKFDDSSRSLDDQKAKLTDNQELERGKREDAAKLDGNAEDSASTTSGDEPARFSGCSSSAASNPPDDDPDDPDVEVVEEIIRTPHTPVLINHDLLCPHAAFDGQAKRVWLTAAEFDELIRDEFAHYQAIPTSADACRLCADQHGENVAKREASQQQLQKIQDVLKKTFRVVEKRRFGEANEPRLTRAICSKFLFVMKNSHKLKHLVALPTVCQCCLLCKAHRKPFFRPAHHDLALVDELVSELSGSRSLAATGLAWIHSQYEPATLGPVPLTEAEWQTILHAVEGCVGRHQFETPPDVELENGEFKEFCTECYEELNRRIRAERCTYPQGAEICVKLKEDDESPEKTTPTGSVRTRSTRRLAQKNVIKLRMRSTDTIKQLKVELYKRTQQSPADQLLYYDERLLADPETLAEAGVPANNHDVPLTLITQQQPADLADSPRQLEKGFRDTALSA